MTTTDVITYQHLEYLSDLMLELHQAGRGIREGCLIPPENVVRHLQASIDAEG